MEITWLGQAGFLFEHNGKKILIDPYLSESCKSHNPLFYRRMPIDERYLEIVPDIIILTHNHLDHTDPDTLKHYLCGSNEITILAPKSAFKTVRNFGGEHNYVRFDRHTEWTCDDIRFYAVKATHSDDSAIGVLIEADGKRYYHTGDTLYNKEIFCDISDDVYALFVVVNGKGNNMNILDAERFTKKISPEFVVPMHWGLHDELYPDNFRYDSAIIPKIYEKITFDEV